MFYILPVLLATAVLTSCVCIYRFYTRVLYKINKGHVQKIRKSITLMQRGMRMKKHVGDAIPKLKILVSMLQVQVGVMPTFSIRLPDVFTRSHSTSYLLLAIYYLLFTTYCLRTITYYLYYLLHATY